MRIAKIFIGDPENRKGFFNNVIERIKHLSEVESHVDSFIIRLEYGLILRALKLQLVKPKREEYTFIDGVRLKNIYIKLGVIDYLLTHRFHVRQVVGIKQLVKNAPLFEDYDLISSHGIHANFFSAKIKEQIGTPFVATWHGSDINVAPFYNEKSKNEIRKVLDVAGHNFFVSKKLLETSLLISGKSNKSVLYTGPAKSFYPYNSLVRSSLRKSYGLQSKFVIGFVGNIIEIKNAIAIPSIFKIIQDKEKSVSFLMVGDGKLRNKVFKDMEFLGVKNIKWLGKVQPKEVPDVMNCLDVLVLPSLNEGLPRVAIEAQACGVKVVGSDRGGIPEAIGIENCFEIGPEFIESLSHRVLELLNQEEVTANLPDKFSWAQAISHENEVHARIANKYD